MVFGCGAKHAGGHGREFHDTGVECADDLLCDRDQCARLRESGQSGDGDNQCESGGTDDDGRFALRQRYCNADGQRQRRDIEVVFGRGVKHAGGHGREFHDAGVECADDLLCHGDQRGGLRECGQPGDGDNQRVPNGAEHNGCVALRIGHRNTNGVWLHRRNVEVV